MKRSPSEWNILMKWLIYADTAAELQIHVSNSLPTTVQFSGHKINLMTILLITVYTYNIVKSFGALVPKRVWRRKYWHIEYYSHSRKST